MMRTSEEIYNLLEQGVSLIQEGKTRKFDIFEQILQPLNIKFLQYCDIRSQTLEDFYTFLDDKQISQASISEKFKTQYVYPDYPADAYDSLLDLLKLKGARIAFLLEDYIRDIQTCMTHPEDSIKKLDHIILSEIDMTNPKIEFLTNDTSLVVLELQGQILEQAEILSDNREKAEKTYINIQKHCLI